MRNVEHQIGIATEITPKAIHLSAKITAISLCTLGLVNAACADADQPTEFDYCQLVNNNFATPNQKSPYQEPPSTLPWHQHPCFRPEYRKQFLGKVNKQIPIAVSNHCTDTQAIKAGVDYLNQVLAPIGVEYYLTDQVATTDLVVEVLPEAKLRCNSDAMGCAANKALFLMEFDSAMPPSTMQVVCNAPKEVLAHELMHYQFGFMHADLEADAFADTTAFGLVSDTPQTVNCDGRNYKVFLDKEYIEPVNLMNSTRSPNSRLSDEQEETVRCLYMQ